MANKQEKKVYSSKMATIQVIGGLLVNPMLLGDDKYIFSLNDFPEAFHKYVFKAIVAIAMGSDDGEIDILRIEPIDIDRWLKNYPEWYQGYLANDGPAWVQKAMSAYDEKRFHYYYNELKKYSLLNAMERAGFSTSDITGDDLVDPVALMKQREKFDSMSTKDILNTVELSLVGLKEKYDSSDTKIESNAGEDIFATIASLKESPEVGAGFMSPYLTTAMRGMRLGTLTVESSPQGVGKSRRQAGETARLAIPEYYDTEIGEWVYTGYSMPTLLISSELTLKEVQFMWLACVSGVPEERLVLSTMTPEEAGRINHAATLISSAPLYFCEISNYDINDIENLIKKNVLTNDVAYVFFDYMGTTQKILASSASATKMSGLREDQILLMFMERLKNLAKILNIYIYTATQISGNWKEVKEADQQMIRGAKSIADKADGGWVLLPVREADRPVIEQYQEKGFVDVPTHVMHIYKNRGNPMVNVRIYGLFSRNMCRWKDCFVTDFQGKMLDVTPLQVEWEAPVNDTAGNADVDAVDVDFGAFSKKASKLKAVDKDDLTDSLNQTAQINNESSFDFSERVDSSNSWGSSTNETYIDPRAIDGPYSKDLEPEEELPQDEPEAEKSADKQAWGTDGSDKGNSSDPWGGFVF